MAVARQRTDLMVRFAVVSLLPVVVLGLVLGRAVRRSVEQRALDVYTTESSVVLDLFVRNLITEEDFERPIPEDRAAGLRNLLKGIPAPAPVAVEVRVVNREGIVVFATDETEMGARVDLAPLADALAGESSSEFAGRAMAADGEYRLLRLHQAVRLEPGGAILGALEVVAPDTVVGPTIDDDVRRIQLTLAGGLAVMWISLLPIAWQATSPLRRRAEESEHLAVHDALTGLPNRTLFRDRLDQAIASARRRGGRCGLIVIDLDGFKEVNDSLGHHQGDKVLQHAASLLTGALRGSDTVARLGGDEFAVILPDVEDAHGLVTAANRIGKAFDRPLVLDGVGVSVGASMGGALFPDHADDGTALVQRADAAMYVAKEGEARFHLFSPATESHHRSRLTQVADLRWAVASSKGLVVEYQPRVATDGCPVGVEALVRWEHPEHGPVARAELAALAETAGLGTDLALRVVDLAGADACGWLDDGVNLWLAVDFPAASLRDPDLPRRLAAVLDRHQLPPSRLVLQAPEEALVSGGPGSVDDVVGRLRALGVSVALADFATGLSTLARLGDLSVDHAIIDRAFVDRLARAG
ncbi:MAG TPA: diguanylate cyclase, partial [Acidimicrobiales bacterium]